MPAYMTETDADTYFSERYPSEEWDIANTPTKTRVLATATRLIDQLNFVGDKTVSTQENEFPRWESTEVPTAVKNACCEIAYTLLEGADPNYNSENIHVSVSRFGLTSTTKDIVDTPLHLIHGIPSSVAWNYLLPYLRSTSRIKIERMS